MDNAQVVYADNPKQEIDAPQETTDFQEAEVVEEAPSPQPTNEPKPEVKNEEEADF